MATLRIYETGNLLYNLTSNIFDLRNVTIQNITFSTAQQSAAFQSDTTIIRLLSDVNCHILVGSNPTADLNDMYLRAGVEYDFYVTGGTKLSVVQAA